MRILIVKLSSLGDVVQTLPVVHDIHARFPGAAVDWVVEEAFAPLLRQAPTIARVLPLAQRRWRKARWDSGVRRERREFLRVLREQSYDAVLDLQGLIKSALVARKARLAPGGFTASFGNRSELCGYEWPVRYLVNRAVPMPRRVHAVARTRWMAAAALGYDTAVVVEQPPVYPWARETATGAPQVVFAHGTTRADNEWPEHHWRALGERFAAEGFQVLLPQGRRPRGGVRAAAGGCDRSGRAGAAAHGPGQAARAHGAGQRPGRRGLRHRAHGRRPGPAGGGDLQPAARLARGARRAAAPAGRRRRARARCR
ncbi:lipopolysaccharide heptosyltransferase I [Ramlibacter sp. B156]|uniref:Lipopolysaccharide heptosyltransferase 1 n=1 Tax=Ramlibacter montanisoli TaxID=2732512 RepID=A0A849KPZ7_9BURK|nr:lipopolysaccharide heptosyltransferase I [Ramlibacter montanisoli]NNU43889.1 lipopolysaccharide heptosyltransferase I [Ramlibacter montanisoli]